MDKEAEREIERLKARIRELEAKLAVASMPGEVSALLEDLDMVPDTAEEPGVTLEMMEEFVSFMGYETCVVPAADTFLFTDMFKEYGLELHAGDTITLSLFVPLSPEADRTLLSFLIGTRDLGADGKFDMEKDAVILSLHSVGLTKDSYRSTIRFFIGELDEAEKSLFSMYDAVCEGRKEGRYMVRMS